MGSLFWQINDCWPVASWSSIDYYGRWKAQQYFARKSFAPVLVTSSLNDGQVTVQVISDRLKDQPATLTLEVTGFHGAVTKTIRQNIVLKANSSVAVFKGAVSDLLAGASPESAFLHASLSAGGKAVAEDILYFRAVKELSLPQASITTKVKDLNGAYAIALSSPTLAKNVHLSLDETGGFFTDNYFDLLPGKPAIVTFMPATPASAQTLENSPKLMHMALLA
jgi:beta-mannosidase